jgi:N-acetylglucosamine-6-sulfatase
MAQSRPALRSSAARWRTRRRGGRILLALVVSAAALLAVAPGHEEPGALAAARPNVFFYNLDDLRDQIPGGIDPLAFMPKLRGWMASGRRYTQSFVADPACCPSRASLMTGRFPHNEGVLHQGDGPKFDVAHSLQNYLHRSGYGTFLAGKFLTTWPQTAVPPDFDHTTVIWGGYWNVAARVDGVSKQLAGYSTTALGVQGRTYIDQALASQKPFYLYETPQAPHVVPVKQSDGSTVDLAQPDTAFANAAVGTCAAAGEADTTDKPPWVRWWTVTQSYAQRVCTTQMQAIMSADVQFDLTMQMLKSKGVLSNTLVIFSSDNGYLWHEHNRISKFAPYEPSMRVPLVVWWPGHVLPGIDNNRITSYLDIMPTILAATGTPVPAGAPALDGESLLVTSRRTVAFGEYWLDSANGGMQTWKMVRTSKVKYIQTYDSGGTLTFREYYDLASDPTEQLNLLGDASKTNDPPPSTVAAMAALLDAESTCSGSSCVR